MVKTVRGQGLLLGIVLTEPISAATAVTTSMTNRARFSGDPP